MSWKHNRTGKEGSNIIDRREWNKLVKRAETIYNSNNDLKDRQLAELEEVEYDIRADKKLDWQDEDSNHWTEYSSQDDHTGEPIYFYKYSA